MSARLVELALDAREVFRSMTSAQLAVIAAELGAVLKSRGRELAHELDLVELELQLAARRNASRAIYSADCADRPRPPG